MRTAQNQALRTGNATHADSFVDLLADLERPDTTPVHQDACRRALHAERRCRQAWVLLDRLVGCLEFDYRPPDAGRLLKDAKEWLAGD